MLLVTDASLATGPVSFDVTKLPSVTEPTTKPDDGVPESMLTILKDVWYTCGSGKGTNKTLITWGERRKGQTVGFLMEEAWPVAICTDS